MGGHVLDYSGSVSGQMVDCCAVDNESSGCIKDRVFGVADWLLISEEWLQSMYLGSVTEWKSLRYNIIFTAFHLLTDPVHHRTEGRYPCAGYCRGNYYIAFIHTCNIWFTAGRSMNCRRNTNLVDLF